MSTRNMNTRPVRTFNIGEKVYFTGIPYPETADPGWWSHFRYGGKYTVLDERFAPRDGYQIITIKDDMGKEHQLGHSHFSRENPKKEAA